MEKSENFEVEFREGKLKDKKKKLLSWKKMSNLKIVWKVTIWN